MGVDPLRKSNRAYPHFCLSFTQSQPITVFFQTNPSVPALLGLKACPYTDYVLFDEYKGRKIILKKVSTHFNFKPLKAQGWLRLVLDGV
jgi:hypothetical protein